jgi:GNAT superfamily N-acetyltransferase
MSPLIRLAIVSDTEAISSLVKGYWQFEHIEGFDRVRTISLLNNFLKHENLGKCWVAEIDGQLKGYLLIVYVFSLEFGGPTAEIDEFFVTTEKRSSQIGAALLNAATQSLARDGFPQLQLQLGINNASGKRYYERQGFEPLSGYALWHKSLQSGAGRRDC